MKKMKLAIGLLVAGVGAIGSAFTVKDKALESAGWYAAPANLAKGSGSFTYSTSFGTSPVSTNSSTTPPTALCNSHANFVCVVYFTANQTTSTDYYTGTYNG